MLCTGAGGQQWNFDSEGRLKDLSTQRCLTIARAVKGTPIVLLPCDPGNPGQVWSLGER
jgi:hypothetical protein